LKEIIELTKKVRKHGSNSIYPVSLKGDARKSLYDNLDKNEDLAINVDIIVRETKKDNFRGNIIKEREIKKAIRSVLETTYKEEQTLNLMTKQIFELVKNQNEY